MVFATPPLRRSSLYATCPILFVVLNEHKQDELYLHPTFLGMNRGPAAMIITVLEVILPVAIARWSACLQGNSESCNIGACRVGRHSTIRRIASRHYSAKGLLRACRRLQRAI